MNSNTKLFIKNWVDLTPEELDQMNKSHQREWKAPAMTAEDHGNNLFFLLKKDNDILAQGQLVPISGITFNGETFDIMGIGGIIASVKGQGYGSKIMKAIKNYLMTHRKTGVGFTGVSDFYEKSGFSVNNKAIKRFVHVSDNQRIVNTESDRVCYLDSDDKFMEKVLKDSDKDVYLPRDPNW